MDDSLFQALTAAGGAGAGSALLWMWVRTTIAELRTEVRSLNARCDSLFERVVTAESTAKALHQRFDRQRGGG